MQTRDAARKRVGRIKKGCVGIRYLDCTREPSRALWLFLDTLQQFHRAPRPHCPMTEQPPYDSYGAPGEFEWRQQIDHDAVIVAGIESDVTGASGFRHGAHDIDGLVSIKGRHLNGDDVFNLGKIAPEFV